MSCFIHDMKKNVAKSSVFKRYKKYIPLFLFLFCFALYANTIGHEFTQDDAIVIYKNSFTTEGLSGISDIFSKDSFHGFFGEDKSNLVSGGRYRPLTLAYFAIFWELFGHSEVMYHLSNVVMYGFLVVLLFYFLTTLKPFKSSNDVTMWALISTVLFAAHPIHTEVVANVKGLDEIWSLGFGILASLSVLKFVDTRRKVFLFPSSIFIILGLLAKENAISFLAIIPLSVLFFRKTSLNQKLLISLSLGVAALVYLAIRTSVVGFSIGNEPMEMMNNPFIKLVDGAYYKFTASEKWASIIYGLGKDVQLLFFPHPLTHDYYPRHFAVMNFMSPEVILAVIMNIMVAAFAIVDYKRKSIVSYSAFFYLASIALTSNIIFPIGTHLSERFLFMPSVGFAMLMGLIFLKTSNSIGKKSTSLVYLLVLVLFSIKTISRNTVWQSDYTLFTTDVHTSKNSAKVQNAAGGAMLTKANEISDIALQKELRSKAKVHLTNAISIHPGYKNAYLLLGNAQFGLEEYDDAITSYEKALQIDGNYTIAHDNLILAYREGARYEGSKKGNIQKAIQYLFKVDVLQPGNYETISLLGIAHGNSGQHSKALEYFLKALNLQPDNVQAHLNLSNVYLNIGDVGKSDFHKQKAKQ